MRRDTGIARYYPVAVDDSPLGCYAFSPLGVFASQTPALVLSGRAMRQNAVVAPSQPDGTWRYSVSRGRARKILLTLVMAFVLFVATPLAASSQTETKPFNPKVAVELCEGGKYKTPSTHPACEGEPLPGTNTDVRLRITQEEGEPLLNSGSLKSSGFPIPPGSTGPNYDKVGEGKVSIKEASFGVVSPVICLVNQNPPASGDHATVIAIIVIGGAEPCNPKSTPPPTTCATLHIIGSGAEFQYKLELDLGGGSASGSVYPCSKGESLGGGIKLTTPIDLDIVFYGKSKPNADVKPATPGGVPIFKLPDQGGEFSWSGEFSDAAGTKVTSKSMVIVESPAPPPGPKSPIIPILVIVGIIVIGIVGYKIWSKSNQKKFQDWDYYDEYGDYDESYGGGYDQGYQQGYDQSYDQGYDQSGGQSYDQSGGGYADDYGQQPPPRQ